MNTMFRLTTLGALLACAGVAMAGNATPSASLEYPSGSVCINPQPLPPLSDASAERDTSSQYRPGPICINPQPLPPRE